MLLWQGCTNPMRQIALEIKLLTATPKSCGFLVRNFCHVKLFLLEFCGVWDCNLIEQEHAGLHLWNPKFRELVCNMTSLFFLPNLNLLTHETNYFVCSYWKKGCIFQVSISSRAIELFSSSESSNRFWGHDLLSNEKYDYFSWGIVAGAHSWQSVFAAEFTVKCA